MSVPAGFCLFVNDALIGCALNNTRIFRIESPSVIRYDKNDRVINTWTVFCQK
jgi:hypothetical protein